MADATLPRPAPPAASAPAGPHRPSTHLTLLVIALTGLMLILDLTITNVVASPIFFLTLYLQQILGFSAVQAGLATLPLALAVIAAARLAPKLINRLGPGRLLAGGLALAAAGLVLLGRIHPAGKLPRRRGRPNRAARPWHGAQLRAADRQRHRRGAAGRPGAGLRAAADRPAARRRPRPGRADQPRHRHHRGTAGPPQRPRPGPAALQAALTGGYAAALRGAALLALAGAALAFLILPSRRRPPIHPPTHLIDTRHRRPT
jgi:hypothetical protein